MIRPLLAAVLVSCVSLQAHADEPAAADRQTLLRQAASLHDGGNYAGAIQVYQLLLDRDANDVTALYEIAFSYSAARSWKQCIDYATRASHEGGGLQSQVLGLLATCEEGEGRREQALRTFAAAVEKYPGDYRLRFNYAVSLGNAGRAADAVAQLEAAITTEPRFPSSYYSYGKLLEAQRRDGVAACLYMRFLLLEPGSARSRDAATRIVALVNRQIATGEGGKPVLNLNLPKEASTQEHALAIALGTSAMNGRAGAFEGNNPKVATLATLETFLRIAASLADKEQSFHSRFVLAPLAKVQNGPDRAAFLQHILSLGGGAQGN